MRDTRATTFGGNEVFDGQRSRLGARQLDADPEAGDRDDAITVMVIEEISDGLFPNQKLPVRSVSVACGLRKREGNLS